MTTKTIDNDTLHALRLYFGGVGGPVDLDAADDTSAAFCGDKRAMARTIKRLAALPSGWSQAVE